MPSALDQTVWYTSRGQMGMSSSPIPLSNSFKWRFLSSSSTNPSRFLAQPVREDISYFTWLADHLGWSHLGWSNTWSLKQSVCCPGLGSAATNTHGSHLLAVIKSSLWSPINRVGIHHPPQAAHTQCTAHLQQAGAVCRGSLGRQGAAAQWDGAGGFLTAGIPCPQADGAVWQCHPAMPIMLAGEGEEICS